MKIESIVFEGANIPCVQDDTGEVFVAIKPICDAMGLDVRKQKDRIKADEVVNQPLPERAVVAKDGKVRMMFCIPLKYLSVWLCQIPTNSVKPESREILLSFKRECQQVLYAHFFGAGQVPVSGPLGAAEMHVHNCMILQSELYLLQEKRRAVDKAITAKTKQIAQYNYRATPYQQQQLLFASRLQEEANIPNY